MKLKVCYFLKKIFIFEVLYGIIVKLYLIEKSNSYLIFIVKNTSNNRKKNVNSLN